MNPVVRLVQKSGSVGSLRVNVFVSIFFRIEIRTSVMFSWSWSTIAGLWWMACKMVYFFTCCSSRRQSIHFDLAMNLFLRFADRKSSAPSLLRRSHRLHGRTVGEERSGKSSTATQEENTQSSWSQTVQTTRLVTTCSQSPWYQQSDRTETSSFDSQNDATARRTVTTFVWPQT